MKRLAALALLLCLLSLTPTYAQTSGQSTSTLTGAEKNKVIRHLVSRVQAAEQSIEAKEQRIKALNTQIAEMERSGGHLSDAYRAALLELGELKGEVKHLRAAVEELKVNLEEVRGERDTAQAKVKSLKNENRLLKLVLVARTAIDIGRIFF